eukprot:g18967.t1
MTEQEVLAMLRKGRDPAPPAMDFGSETVMVPKRLLSEILEDGICPLHLRIQIQRFLLDDTGGSTFRADRADRATGSIRSAGLSWSMFGQTEVSTTLECPTDPLVTAAAMRGLNRRETRESLEAMLFEASRHLDRPKYDFVYLPWATRKACNIGLAFVNFEDHAACVEFFNELKKAPHLLRNFAVRYIGPATLQGRGPNLQDTIAKRGVGILDAGDAPLVFDGGERSALLDVVRRELPELWDQLQLATWVSNPGPRGGASSSRMPLGNGGLTGRKEGKDNIVL